MIVMVICTMVQGKSLYPNGENLDAKDKYLIISIAIYPMVWELLEDEALKYSFLLSMKMIWDMN